MRYSRRLNTESTDLEASFEIDLSPLLALMVTLIPVMLLATAFTKVVVIESNIPQVVQQALEDDRKKKDRDISISLYMSGANGFELKVTEDGKPLSSTKVAKVDEKTWDLEKLHGLLANVKSQYPKIFRLDLFPDSDVLYAEIVKVIDASRNLNSKDPEVFLEDEKTGKKVKLKIMYPDVVFSNVVEG